MPSMFRRNAIRSTARILAGLLLALCAIGGYEAVATIVDPDTGYLLAVDVISDPYDPVIQGVRLREQPPGGVPVYETIPSSYDPILDADPVVAKGAGTSLVVVWSRHDGEDLELALSRRIPGYGWEHFNLLTDNGLADTQARAFADLDDAVHVLWWGNGLGGPILLQAFDAATGYPRGPSYRPFEPPAGVRRPVLTLEDEAGGLDDPGIPTKAGYQKASAYPCEVNPNAAPDHGVLKSCGRAAAWQVSSCQLVVGVQDVATGSWSQTVVDLSNVGSISPQSLAQGIADQKCE